MKRIPLTSRSCCALCLKSAKLCKSHIISRFLLWQAFAESNSAVVKSVFPGEPSFKNQGDGHWERLLCWDCEQRFQTWETYARDILFDRPKRIDVQSHLGIHITGIDYRKFKLFQMSLLWRISACRLPFYSRVRLGPLEEELRQMLVDGDAGDPTTFGCTMVALTMQDGTPACPVIEPVTATIRTFRRVHFYAGGFAWTFSVSRRPNLSQTPYFLSREGEIFISTFDLMDMPSFAQLAVKINRKEFAEKLTKKV